MEYIFKCFNIDKKNNKENDIPTHFPNVLHRSVTTSTIMSWGIQK